MVTYFIIGIIVSALEMFLAYRDLKKYGLSIYDVFPNLNLCSFGQKIFLSIFTFVGIAIVWPLQVAHWIYRIVSYKKVQENEEDSA